MLSKESVGYSEVGATNGVGVGDRSLETYKLWHPTGNGVPNWKPPTLGGNFHHNTQYTPYCNNTHTIFCKCIEEMMEDAVARSTTSPPLSKIRYIVQTLDLPKNEIHLLIPLTPLTTDASPSFLSHPMVLHLPPPPHCYPCCDDAP